MVGSAEPDVTAMLQQLLAGQATMSGRLTVLEDASPVKTPNLPRQGAEGRIAEGGPRGAAGASGSTAKTTLAGAIYSAYAAADTRYFRPPHAPLAPGQWDLYGNKTFDTLAASKGSPLVHEFKSLYPAVSYMYDQVCDLEDGVQQLEPSDDSEQAMRLVRAYNTGSGVLRELQKRLGVLQATAVAMSSQSPTDKAVGELAREKARGYGDDVLLYDPTMQASIEELREKATAARLKSLATAAGGAPREPHNPKPPAPRPNPTPKPAQGAAQAKK